MSRRSAPKILIRVLTSCLVVGLLIAIGNTVMVRLKAPLPRLVPQMVDAAAPTGNQSTSLAWPAFGQAAVGIVGRGILAVNGVQTPVPTASTAKLITALAVLRVKPITPGSQGPLITLTQSDVDSYNTYAAEDGSVARVTVGEQISEYQALQGMLLPSANNLADSLAVWAFGSLQAYADYANHMLAGLELLQTHVGSDASGFSPTTTSTAADLVRLGELAEAEPVLADIVSQRTADMPVAGTVTNVNRLLGTADINGIKTGNSNQAGGVFVFSASYLVAGRQNVTIVGAVMRAADLNQAIDSALPLLTSSQKALGYSTVLLAGQAVGQYHVPWGGQITAVTTRAVRSLAWQGKPLDKPVVDLNTLNAPLASDTVVGSVGLGTDAQKASGSPIKLAQSVPKPSLWWRIIHS